MLVNNKTRSAQSLSVGSQVCFCAPLSTMLPRTNEPTSTRCILCHSRHGLLRLEGGNIGLLSVFDHGPVIFEIVGLVAIKLGLLVDQCASAVELTVDCLDSDLCAVVLSCISDVRAN